MKKFLSKLFGRELEAPPLAPKELAGALRADPGQYLTGYNGKTYEWKHSPDMYFKVGKQPVAYIQRIEVFKAAQVVRVGHFALDSDDMKGTGAGRALAIWFAQRCRVEFGTTHVHFAEDSPRFVDAGYAGFFTAIGCNPQEDTRPSKYPLYVWDIRPAAGHVP